MEFKEEPCRIKDEETEELIGPVEVNEEEQQMNDVEAVFPQTEQNHYCTSLSLTCSECGKCFNRKADLKRHMKIHTGGGLDDMSKTKDRLSPLKTSRYSIISSTTPSRGHARDTRSIKTEEDGLISKKRCSSFVWQYFGFRPDADGEPADLTEAICRLCKKKVKVKDGQTTNLHSHIQIHHPAVAASFQSLSSAASRSGKKYEQTPITAAFADKKYEKSSSKWTQCTHAVTRFLVKEMMPLGLVDREGFRAMLQTFDHHYEVPNREYFSRTAIPELYSTVKAEVMTSISSADYVALTTEMWSCSNTMTTYMSIAAHYIDKDWVLQSHCLGTVYVPESHTADYLAESLVESVKEWGIDEGNISCVTTDSGADITAAIRQLKWPWLHCFGHNLNAAITSSLQKVRTSTDRAFAVCRAINGAFSKSWHRRRDLTRAQEELDVPRQSLVTDCPTHWRSKLKMTERILQQAPAIRRVFADDKSRRPLPNLTWQDISVLEAVSSGLKPVADLTDVLSGESYVTVSCVTPVLEHTRRALTETHDEPQLSRKIKTGILKELSSKYENAATQKLLRISTMLDPRYSGGFNLKELEQTKNELLDAINDCLRKKNQENAEEEQPSTSVQEVPLKKKKITLGDLLGKAPKPPTSEADRAAAELTAYLLEDVIDGEENPLAWWKNNDRRFPLLSSAARKFLCVPATSGPSERLFSTAGQNVSPFQKALTPEKMNMLVFLSRNLH